MIGSLIYFGVYDAENYFPDRCALGHPIQCNDHAINYDATDGNVEIELLISNNDLRPFNVTSVTVISEVLRGKCANYITNPVELKKGETQNISVTTPEGPGN